jgi:hypothetical protein
MSDEKIDQKKQNLVNKAVSFGRAIASKGITNKKAESKTLELRKMSCHGDSTKNLPPCSERKDSEKFPGSFYCGACGCGDKAHTQLVNGKNPDGSEKYSKLDYPKVTCPLKMPGFVNYVESQTGVSENPRKLFIEMTIGVSEIKENSK